MRTDDTATPPADFLSDGGEMGALMRSHDWPASALGAPAGWPVALRIAIRLILNTGHPMCVFWGPQRICFYNDAYRASIGAEGHPGSLGRPAREVWAEVWNVIGPQIDQVMRAGGASSHQNQWVPVMRDGVREAVHWTCRYGPLDDDDAPHGVGGVLVTCTETTATVLAERRHPEAASQRRLLEQAPGFVVVMQGPQHVVEFVNLTHRRIFGSDEWVGKPIREAFPDISGQGFFELLDEVYATGKPHVASGATARFRHTSDGIEDTRVFDFIYSPLRGDDDEVTGVFCEGLDITERVVAEAAMRESEVRFGEVADAAPVMIWMSDTTTACTWFNKPWLAFTGRTLAQERGNGWTEGVHPDDHDRCIAVYTAAFDRREVFRIDYRLRRHDGEWRTVDDHGAPRFSAEGLFLGYIGSCIDVTEQRETEAALRASEEQLRLATDLAEVGLWDVDVVGESLYWPSRVKAMFGISPEVPVSMADFYAGLHPQDLERVAAAYAAAADPLRRALYDVEYRTIGQEDGLVRWVAARGRGVFDSAGRCVRLIGTALDITRRKLAEERLRDSEAALRMMNETLEAQVAARTAERDRVWRNSRDLLVVIGADGLIDAVSPSWTTLLGHLPHEVVGRELAAFAWPAEGGSTEAAIAPATATAEASRSSGDGLDSIEQRLRHRDGTPRWIAWRTSVEAGMVFAYGRDVTLDKQREEQLVKVEEALRQAQKMEAIGQLTGGIAHDFNNLLQGVAGNFELIRRKLPQDGSDHAKLRSWAENGLRSVERGAKLTQQLLAFSRSQKLETKPVVVADLLVNLRDLLARTLGPAVRIVFELDSVASTVLGDDIQLEMAVLNLAINARDAMPQGGELKFSMRRSRIDGDPELADGEYVCLSVRDTGTGMAPDVAARAFDPFFTTKGVGKGTGLGLSQVYGMLRQARGTARIESRPGGGTTVHLYLPCTDEAVPVDRRASDQPSPASAVANVLIVDDDPDVRCFLADSLDALGYCAFQAEDGPAGIAAIDRSVPDAVIVDFAMPGMTGAELARELRARRPGLPIIFASGFADTAAIENLPGEKAPILRKPFRIDELQAVLADALRKGGRS